jgi:ribosomal protein S18 acetylase RimI-like enzyme
MIIEPYLVGHRDACLALFDSNVPRYFYADERAGFETFLDAPLGPYFVGRLDGKIIAAGGYAEDRGRAGTWALCWGIVAAPLHHRGFGQELLKARLHALSELPGVQEVRINTTQHTSGFFERFGFVVTEIEQHGYGPELHRYAMLRNFGPSPIGGLSTVE